MFWRGKNWAAIVSLLLAATAPALAQNLQSFDVNPSALFFRNPTGAALTQTITVTPAPSDATLAAAQTFPGSPATWLLVTSTSSGTALTLQVSVSLAALTNGVYTGHINISAAGFVPRAIPVTLTVLPIVGGSNPVPAPALVASPDSLVSQAVASGAGSTLPPVSLSNFSTASYAWTATTSTTTNANWLSVTPAQGNGDALLQVLTSARNLAAGTYSGTITINSGALSTRIAVTLVVAVNQSPALGALPPVLTFQATQIGPSPAPQVININNSGGGSFTWSAQASLLTGGSTSFGGGGPWLSIISTPAQSATTQSQGTIVASANPGSLSAGLYNGIVTVTAGSAKQTIPVYMRVGKAPVIVSPRELFFTVNQGVLGQSSSTVTLTGGPSGAAYTVKFSTASGGNWLQVLPLTGSVATNGSLAVSLQSAVARALNPGLYYGQVLISTPGAAQESTSVRAVLKVFAATDTPRLLPSVGGIIVSAAPGSSSRNSSPSVLLLGGSLGATTVGITASTVSGGNWLQVPTATFIVSPTVPGSFTVDINGNGLAQGAYLGKIILTAAGNAGIAPLTIPVTLVITPPTQGNGVAPGALTATFASPATGLLSSPDLPNPLVVQVVDAQGVGVPGATVVVSSSNSEPPVTLHDSGGGIYSGLFRALSPGPVTLTAATTYSGANGIQTAPTVAATEDLESPAVDSTIYVNGVVSAASYAPSPTPVAPGSLNSVFGLRIAGTGAMAGPPFPLPATLGGASFTFGGLPGALIAAVPSASSDQVNLQVPFELESAGLTSAEVIATVNGTISPAETLVLGDVPSVFSTNQMGTGTVAAQHATTMTAVTAASPAIGGEILSIYATGLGPLKQPVVTGGAATGGALIQNSIQVTIGGLNAPVSFAGLAPGFAGLYQINLTMPTGAGIGDLPLTLTIAGNPGTGSVTVPAR